MATMRLDSAMTPVPTVVYDANGNTLNDAQGRSFTWDFENRLTQVTVPQTGGGSSIVAFKYDSFGRRIQKSGPLGTTNYLYDGLRKGKAGFRPFVYLLLAVASTGFFVRQYAKRNPPVPRQDILAWIVVLAVVAACISLQRVLKPDDGSSQASQ
jgi:hypothetical protein